MVLEIRVTSKGVIRFGIGTVLVIQMTGKLSPIGKFGCTKSLVLPIIGRRLFKRLVTAVLTSRENRPEAEIAAFPFARGCPVLVKTFARLGSGHPRVEN
jgi:hypothetical protein